MGTELASIDTYAGTTAQLQLRFVALMANTIFNLMACVTDRGRSSTKPPTPTIPHGRMAFSGAFRGRTTRSTKALGSVTYVAGQPS